MQLKEKVIYSLCVKEIYINNLKIMKNLISEVTSNKELIKAGVKLTYMDNANFQKWEVTEIFDWGFEANDWVDTKDFYFNELQLGWEITWLDKLLYVNKK